jgi:hypothetical protein
VTFPPLLKKQNVWEMDVQRRGKRHRKKTRNNFLITESEDKVKESTPALDQNSELKRKEKTRGQRV